MKRTPFAMGFRTKKPFKRTAEAVRRQKVYRFLCKQGKIPLSLPTTSSTPECQHRRLLLECEPCRTLALLAYVDWSVDSSCI